MGSRANPVSLIWFILTVGGLHFLLFAVHPPQSPFRLGSAELGNPSPIEVVPAPETDDDARDKPVVQTSRAPLEEQEAARDQKAELASEFRNRTRKQTRAPMRGRFRPGQSPPEVLDPGLNQPRSADGELDAGRPGLPGTLRDLLPSFAASPNELGKDVAEGSQTVLNTDSLRFASYINRVADAVYEPWTQNAREAIHTLHLAGRSLSEQTYITTVGVRMNLDGEVVAVQVIKTSGVSELDDAPKQAFWDRDPFPNPPKGLAETDGLLSFVYEFHFHLRTSLLSIVPQAI